MSNRNEVQPFTVDEKGPICSRIIIRDLFCYRHPQTGHIVKKSYEEPLWVVSGAPPPIPWHRQALINQRKRQIERYNTTAGSLPITDWWWEPPGDPPGAYNPDGSPMHLQEYRAAGGRNW